MKSWLNGMSFGLGGQPNQPYGLVPIATAPGAVIQMDAVVFGEVVAFTDLDIDRKEADVVLQT